MALEVNLVVIRGLDRDADPDIILESWVVRVGGQGKLESGYYAMKQTWRCWRAAWFRFSSSR